MWLLLSACLTPRDPLVAEREALAAVERHRLEEAARDALGRGALTEAAEAVSAGRAMDPSTFGPLHDQLLAALDQADPEAAAPAWAALYEAADTPEARRRARDAALDAAVRARYRPDRRAGTRADQTGVTRDMARAALDALREGYVDALPDGRLLDAAAHRLAVLSERPAPTVDRAPFHEAMDALWDEGVERGLPEEAVVAELTEAAFAAADPWSMPVWPAQVSSWSQHHDGVRNGVVGVVVDDSPDGVVVVGLPEGGPAWAAGVHLDDRVLAVGGLTVGDAEAAAAALRGPDGTDVQLTVLRGGERREIPVTRGSITARTAFGWTRTSDGFDRYPAPRIALVRVGSFRPHTDGEIDALLPDRADLDGLILDLRSNRGGDLDPALLLVERFVAGGQVIGVAGRRIPDALKDGVATATPGDPWEGLPLAVLVDAQTASSAEVVAGALQQLAGATVIGERTAGKGTSQILRTDPAWSHALQYTNLVWTLPDGRRLHRTDDATSWGVAPDVPLVLGPTERFVVGVMQARREALVAHADGSPMRYVGPEVDPSLPPLSADPQIARALEVLASPSR